MKCEVIDCQRSPTALRVGGEGVHLFAFVMVVGVIVGTYSSIYIASPLLLIFREGAAAPAQQQARAPQPVWSLR